VAHSKLVISISEVSFRVDVIKGVGWRFAYPTYVI